MSFSTTFARIIRYGLINLWRNRWLTITAISIMIITLLILSIILLLNQLTSLSAHDLKEGVDISLYFKSDISTDKITEVKKYLENFEEIQEVRFVSADEALENFKIEHKDDTLITQSLQELQKNPLQSSLIIKAKELPLYPAVYQKIKDSRFETLIDKIDYEDNRALIEKLDLVTVGIRNIGIVLTIVFGLVAVLVMFNTLRLTIFSRREEIEIMRLVGASNHFIQGPFLIEGILYGLIATVMASALLIPVLRVTGPWITGFFGLDLSQASYFGRGFWQIVLIQAGTGIVLGVISSVIASKKYLRA